MNLQRILGVVLLVVGVVQLIVGMTPRTRSPIR